MKKKLLILSACIGLILACFQFTLYAEEDPESDLGISAPYPIPNLDTYFYDNYEILPYIEFTGTSNGGQYIDTGIQARGDLEVSMNVSDIVFDHTEYFYGSRSSSSNTNVLSFGYVLSNTYTMNAYYNQTYHYLDFDPNVYTIYNLKSVGSQFYINNQLTYDFELDSTFTGLNMYIGCLNDAGTAKYMLAGKVYGFSIYDLTNEEYLRYYYPARAKSGGTIGLYDAVSKTFVTSANSRVFENPTGDAFTMSISAKITNFILSSLGWIGDIMNFAISEPLIICFMAIGLAGAMFRWGRRLVHF